MARRVSPLVGINSLCDEFHDGGDDLQNPAASWQAYCWKEGKSKMDAAASPVVITAIEMVLGCLKMGMKER